MNVGYIGLGDMGSALARRLLRNRGLSVYDVNPSLLAEFEPSGAAVAPTAAELARRSDIVLLCLPRSSDVRDAIFRTGGLLEGLSPGKIIVDQTGGDPVQTRRMAVELAERGVTLVDAPVSDDVAAADAGTITIMTAGPREICDKVLPVLSAISANVLHCGENAGDAQAMKIVNDSMSAACRLATIEILALGRKMGLSLQCMNGVLNKGSGRNGATETLLPALIEGRTTTDRALSAMLGELNQVASLGLACGAPMPIATTVRGLLQTGAGLLGESAKCEEILPLLASMAGTQIEAEPDPEQAPPVAANAGGLRVGYVGLGVMGGALARRLSLSRKLVMYDVQPELAIRLEASGATVAADLPSLARACDVVMICVPTSSIVRQVLFGKGGLAEGLAPGKIVIDQTTGDPLETRGIARDLAALGVALVDAPVSGGPRGADAGTIAIMCGGPLEAYAKVQPLLTAISPNTVYCGNTGNGHVAKLVNNALASCNRLVTYESTALGFKYGLKLSDIESVINKSTGRSNASQRILPVLRSGGKSADFRLELMVKDLRLASEMAASCGAPIMIAGAVRNLFQAGVSQLGGEKNLDDMATLFERMAAVRFAAP